MRKNYQNLLPMHAKTSRKRGKDLLSQILADFQEISAGLQMVRETSAEIITDLPISTDTN